MGVVAVKISRVGIAHHDQGNDMMYKGYEAVIEYDEEDRLFFGRVINIGEKRRLGVEKRNPTPKTRLIKTCQNDRQLVTL